MTLFSNVTYMSCNPAREQAAGRDVYRVNNHNGQYELLQADGSWTTRRPDDLSEQELDDLSERATRYYDDTTEYCDTEGEWPDPQTAGNGAGLD
jgi:hypothetical protein